MRRPPRVLALSDVHLDLAENRRKFERVCRGPALPDALLLAGDLTDDLDLLAQALRGARSRFAAVFFVPGNHELWVRDGRHPDSLARFWAVLELCAGLGVRTAPAAFGGVWVVPLFSWYTKPEEGPDSLFRPKPGEDPSLSMWADDRLVRWPDRGPGATAAGFFEALNEERVCAGYDRPVVSFSHFLPRRDLMVHSAEERAAGPGVRDRHPEFNFSRVAGSAGLERQIRRLGSRVHVYGHQHRNRWREVDAVLYVSHCMGYPGEDGCGSGEDADRPRVVWDAATAPAPASPRGSPRRSRPPSPASPARSCGRDR